MIRLDHGAFLLGLAAATVDPAGAGTLDVRVYDAATGEPVFARVMLDGPFPDESVQARDQRPFKVGDGLAWLVPESLRLNLPAGEVRVTVERGLEYRSEHRVVRVPPGGSVEAEFRLQRWIHLAERGWYSGDLHLHFPADEVANHVRAEDLNIGTTIAAWISGADHAAETAPIDRHVRVLDPRTSYSVHDMEVERFPIDRYEAPMYLVNLRRHIRLDAPTPAWPLNIEYARRARAEGALVWVHSASWDSVAVLAALQEVDAIGLADNFFGYNYTYTRTRRYGNDDDVATWGDSAEGTYRMVLGKYYKLLNCGFRLPASAGSAAGVKPNPAGVNRAYVQLPGPLTYEGYMAGLKAGRSFVTNGPVVFFTVDGIAPGGTLRLSGNATRVTARATVAANAPLARMNLVHNGRPLAVVDLRHVAPGTEWTWQGDLELDAHSGWLAAHVEAEGELIRFAHTSPVWIDHPRRWVNGEDAAYFAKWIRHRIGRLAADEGFVLEAHRQEVARTLQRAAEIFEALVGASQPPPDGKR